MGRTLHNCWYRISWSSPLCTVRWPSSRSLRTGHFCPVRGGTTFPMTYVFVNLQNILASKHKTHLTLRASSESFKCFRSPYNFHALIYCTHTQKNDCHRPRHREWLGYLLSDNIRRWPRNEANAIIRSPWQGRVLSLTSNPWLRYRSCPNTPHWYQRNTHERCRSIAWSG